MFPKWCRQLFFFLRKIFITIVDIFYPNLCLVCGEWFSPLNHQINSPIVILLCNRCEKLLRPKNQDISCICYLCGRDIKKISPSSTIIDDETIHLQKQGIAAEKPHEDTYQLYLPKLIYTHSITKSSVITTYDGRHNLCESCANDFLNKNPPYFKAARTALYYDETLRYLIHRLKYSMAPHIGEYLAGYLLKAFNKFKEAQDIDYVIPIPLHWLRQLKRGYNQSEILATTFARIIGKKCLTNILIRRQFTSHQARLARDSRLKNITSNIFMVKKSHLIHGKKILLIDDVMTTGVTFNACAKVLLNAGALSVYCLAVTRNEDGR